MSDNKYGVQSHISPTGAPEVANDDGLHPAYEQPIPVAINDGVKPDGWTNYHNYAQINPPQNARSARQKYILIGLVILLIISLGVGLGAGLGVGLSQSKNNAIAAPSTTPSASSSPSNNGTSTVLLIATSSTVSSMGSSPTANTVPPLSQKPVSSCPGSDGTSWKSGSQFAYTIHCNQILAAPNKKNLYSQPLPSFDNCIATCDSLNYWMAIEQLGISGVSAIYRVNGTGTEQVDGTCWCVANSAITNGVTLSPSSLDSSAVLNSTIK